MAYQDMTAYIDRFATGLPDASLISVLTMYSDFCLQSLDAMPDWGWSESSSLSWGPMQRERAWITASVVSYI